MRKIANLKEEKDGIVRVMIFTDNFGTYIFGYKKLEDCSAEWDEWYQTESEAIKSCEEEYGIKNSNWVEIENPKPNCYHDRINPIEIEKK